MRTPFELILISSEQDIADEAKAINKLFSLDLQILHLRKPNWDMEQTQNFLQAIPKKFHGQIVLHAHFQLASSLGLKGIHLNETNKKLVGQFGNHKVISASFHSIEDLKANTFTYQYVFLGPVFNSISKPGYNAKFDLRLLSAELNILKQQNQSLPKIIALGGIDSTNIMKTNKAGFSGAALLGAVWQNENPVEAFLKTRLMTEAK